MRLRIIFGSYIMEDGLHLTSTSSVMRDVFKLAVSVLQELPASSRVTTSGKGISSAYHTTTEPCVAYTTYESTMFAVYPFYPHPTSSYRTIGPNQSSISETCKASFGENHSFDKTSTPENLARHH